MLRHLRAALVIGAIGLFSVGVSALPASAAGFVPIKHAVTGKCIDVKDRSTAVHAVIHQWRCQGEDNQAWLKSFVPGGVQFINQRAGLCLDVRSDGPVPNGTSLQLYPCDGAAVFVLKDPFGNTSQIQHVASGKCIDLDSGRSADGTKIQMWDCIANNTNQLWTMAA
jgi:hypothetical protein